MRSINHLTRLNDLSLSLQGPQDYDYGRDPKHPPLNGFLLFYISPVYVRIDAT